MIHRGCNFAADFYLKLFQHSYLILNLSKTNSYSLFDKVFNDFSLSWNVIIFSFCYVSQKKIKIKRVRPLLERFLERAAEAYLTADSLVVDDKPHTWKESNEKSKSWPPGGWGFSSRLSESASSFVKILRPF